MAVVFRHIISNLMEWVYHEKDEHGIKTAAYAHHAAKRYFSGLDGLYEQSKGSAFEGAIFIDLQDLADAN
jgi:hypothetical protein